MNFQLIKMYLMQYVVKKGRQFLFRSLARTWIYKKILKDIVPYIRLKTYYTIMRGWIYHRGYKLLQPGDIILTKDAAKLTTFIIGGEWSHAALCVGKDGNFEVAEMTHNDYTKSTFADLCFEADYVAIIRCTDWDAEYTKKVIERCLGYEGSQYDVEFTLTRDARAQGQPGDEFLYCSELIYESDIERRLKVNLEDLEQLGRKYISPTGLWRGKNIKIVWESKKEKRV